MKEIKVITFFYNGKYMSKTMHTTNLLLVEKYYTNVNKFKLFS